jgi:diguanylate cyclase
MFWKRSDAEGPVRSASEHRVPTHLRAVDDAELVAAEAIDTIATILGVLARVEEHEAERRTLQGWIHHLVNRARSPATPTLEGTRDWAGARQAITRLLHERRNRTEQALQDLRLAMSTITGTLGRAVADDRAIGAKARAELTRLREAVESKRPEDVRRCALQAVEVISNALDEREKAWARRLGEIRDHARVLEGRLKEAEQEGAVDPLTRLANRRAFDAQLTDALEAGRTGREHSVLVLFDIDHFKRINDTHGHVVGDAVLKTFAHVLSLAFPRQRDCVARFGGEEFAVILRGSKALDGLRLAERALARVRDIELKTDDGIVSVTTSAGVAEILSDDDQESILKRTDAALYRAKQGGRDRAVLAP